VPEHRWTYAELFKSSFLLSVSAGDRRRDNSLQMHRLKTALGMRCEAKREEDERGEREEGMTDLVTTEAGRVKEQESVMEAETKLETEGGRREHGREVPGTARGVGTSLGGHVDTRTTEEEQKEGAVSVLEITCVQERDRERDREGSRGGGGGGNGRQSFGPDSRQPDHAGKDIIQRSVGGDESHNSEVDLGEGGRFNDRDKDRGRDRGFRDRNKVDDRHRHGDQDRGRDKDRRDRDRDRARGKGKDDDKHRWSHRDRSRDRHEDRDRDRDRHEDRDRDRDRGRGMRR
jgi:hypothetical protein